MSSSKHHHLEYPHSSSSAKSNSAKSYFRPQQYCTRTSTVFTGNDASSEDREEEDKHLSYKEHHREFRSWSSRNSYPIRNHPREVAKSAFSTIDDFSRDNTEEGVVRSSSSIQPKESWSMLSLKNSPAFDNPDQPYGRDKLSSVARSLNQHECKAPLQHAPVELGMMEKGNLFASNQTVKHVYKSIQEQCDRILHLLDRNRTERENKGISSARCETAEDQGLGTISDKNMNGVKDENTGIDERLGSHGKEYRDEEVSDHGEGTRAGDDMSAGVEVDSLVWEVDENQDEDEDMGNIELLLGQDWMNGDHVSQIEDEEFWWDSKDLEEEVGAPVTGCCGGHIWFKASDEDQINDREVLLQEWYDIEKTLGIDEETHTMAGDSIGLKEGEILLAEWSLVEEELVADKVFDQHLQTHNQYCVESRNDKIMEIISRARLEIQRVVQTAFHDIQGIQEVGTSEPSSPDLTRSRSSMENEDVKEDYEFNNNLMDALDNLPESDQHPLKLEDIHSSSGVTAFLHDVGFWPESETKKIIMSLDKEYICDSVDQGAERPVTQQDGHQEDGVDEMFPRKQSSPRSPGPDERPGWLPCRWQWQDIWKQNINQMPDGLAQEGAQQRGVAWKRRRNKFYNPSHEIGQNAWAK